MEGALDIPELSVLLTPRFDKEENATGLQVTLTIGSSQIKDEEPLVRFSSLFGGIPVEEGFSASDEEGLLPIVKERSELRVAPNAGREALGDVQISYYVSASSSNQSKLDGPIVGLYRDQRGLIGSGFSFMASPPLAGSYRMLVRWDLRQAPQGTRAVWTYGEGPAAVETKGPASMLQDSVYMVGRVHSIPPAPKAGSISDYYGYYWFGNLPPNIKAIQREHYRFFRAFSELFETTPSPINCHRSFVRNGGNTKCFVSTSFLHSHVLDYDTQIDKIEVRDLFRRMSYEMTQTWLGPPVTAVEFDWLYEGMRDCLSICIPYSDDFRKKDYTRATINMLCTKYYTSPLTQKNLGLDTLLELSVTDAYAREHLTSRAWAFVFWVDLRARSLSELARPLEDLVMKPLAKNKARGAPHGINDFVGLLKPLMHDEILQHYKSFHNGAVIRLPSELHEWGNGTHSLKLVQELVLDFGMHRTSFATGTVKGLKAGSRAEVAGIVEGDKIVWSSHEWRCVEDPDECMILLIERGGVETKVKYLPRDWEAVESWQMVEKVKEKTEEEKKKQARAQAVLEKKPSKPAAKKTYKGAAKEMKRSRKR